VTASIERPSYSSRGIAASERWRSNQLRGDSPATARKRRLKFRGDMKARSAISPTVTPFASRAPRPWGGEKRLSDLCGNLLADVRPRGYDDGVSALQRLEAALGQLPGAGRVDRQVCPRRRAPRRGHDRCSSRAPGVRRMVELLGDDGVAIPFLRYLPERLSPLGSRVGTALHEVLAESPIRPVPSRHARVTRRSSCRTRQPACG
jgi:hypothetical protein